LIGSLAARAVSSNDRDLSKQSRAREEKCFNAHRRQSVTRGIR
jgi:hypothetical protein